MDEMFGGRSTMEYYEVVGKCGHVGRGYYIQKTFPVVALSSAEAADKVRSYPRVKHHHKDAIKQVTAVSQAAFDELCQCHASDPYFRCHSIQEQRATCLLDLIPEQGNEVQKGFAETQKQIYDHKRQIRKPKKYIRNYPIEMKWAV